MPLASEVLNKRATNRGAAAREQDIWTTCRRCGKTVRLNAATVDTSDPLEVTYSCPVGCGPILIVSSPGVVPWEGRGYRLGDWMLRNPSDLFCQGRGMSPAAKIPASPHALD